MSCLVMTFRSVLFSPDVSCHLLSMCVHMSTIAVTVITQLIRSRVDGCKLYRYYYLECQFLKSSQEFVLRLIHFYGA